MTSVGIAMTKISPIFLFGSAEKKGNNRMKMPLGSGRAKAERAGSQSISILKCLLDRGVGSAEQKILPGFLFESPQQ
jgi:hypothetical protein